MARRTRETTKAAALRLGRKRGQKPKLENRPDAADILDELRAGGNISAIAVRLGVHRNTLSKFKAKYQPPSVEEAAARASRLPRLDLQVSQMERLDAVSSKLDLMVEAIDRTLRDPEDPTRYNLDPRAREVTVVFEETVGERRVQKVRKLDDLLERVEQGLGVSVVRWEVKSADLRTLLKDLAATIRPIAETLGKNRGELKSDPVISMNVFLETKEWAQLEGALLEAVRPCPRCLEAAGRALATIGGPSDAR